MLLAILSFRYIFIFGKKEKPFLLIEWTRVGQIYQLSVIRKLSNIYEPVHEISNNVVCATSKASDQPVHTRSLIRALLVA